MSNKRFAPRLAAYLLPVTLFVGYLGVVSNMGCSSDDNKTPKVIAVTGVSLNKNITTLGVYNTESLVPTVAPSNATNPKISSWSTSDPAVATVVNGAVTANSVGTAVISVVTEDGSLTDTCTINVVIPTEDVTLNMDYISFQPGATQSVTLKATVTPNNATQKGVRWSSSNSAVATVTDEGVVRAVAPGAAVITVNTIEGGHSATCDVVVVGYTYGTEAGIANIAISSGKIQAVSENEYEATVITGAPNFAVTVTLIDPKGSVWINGKKARSGSPVPVTIYYGLNTISIGTLAEDLVAYDHADLSVNKVFPNTAVSVLAAAASAPIKGAVLTLKDANDELIEDNIVLPDDSHGELWLALDQTKLYNIYATGTDRARSTINRFDPSREGHAILVCLPKVANAEHPNDTPIFNEIAFTTGTDGDPVVPFDITENVVTVTPVGTSETRSSISQFRLKAISKNMIAPVTNRSIPFKVNLDSSAFTQNNSGSDFAYYINNSSLAPIGEAVVWQGETYLQTNATGTISSGAYPYWIERDAFLDFTVYDVANNRANRRVYINPKDMLTPDDGDISGVVPTITRAVANTWGMTQTYWNSKDPISPVDPSEISANALPVHGDYGYSHGVQIYIQLSAPVIAYRGWEIWRSDSPTSGFVRVAVINNANRSTGATPNGWDYAGGMSFGTQFYKVRFFNANLTAGTGGFSRYSEPFAIKPLPPFTTILEAPYNSGTSAKIWPTFKFSITDASLLRNNSTDAFDFKLYVKNAATSTRAFHVRFRAQFDAQGNPVFFINAPGTDTGTNFVPATHLVGGEQVPFVHLENGDTIVIDTDVLTFKSNINVSPLEPNVSYEWSIFGPATNVPAASPGLTTAANNAAMFQKTYNPTGPTNATVYGSTAANRFASGNGYFTLVIATNAQ